MQAKAHRDFDASPEQVWAIIREPGSMPAWNPKCVRCDDIGPGRVGARFNVVFTMKGREHPCVAEVVSWVPNQEIVFRYDVTHPKPMGRVTESLKIVPRRSGVTRLRHTVDFRETTLPWWVKLLIGWIGTFGKPVDGEPLDGLDDLLARD